MRAMYLDALSFLEDERDAWRPYERLGDLTDDQLAIPVDAAHGWSGRDLIGHLVGWLELGLTVARELAVNEGSPAKIAADREWDERGEIRVNEELLERFAALPMDEVRRRFEAVPGELRGYLTVVPETRWVKNAEYLEFFLSETMDHYADHMDDLAAILVAAG